MICLRRLLVWSAISQALASRIITSQPVQPKTCAGGLKAAVLRADVQGMFEAAKDWKMLGVLKTVSYKLQWEDAASKVPFLPGKSATWGDILHFDAYSFERDRMRTLGRIAETSDVVSESQVRKICDLSAATLRSLVHSTAFVNALVSELPPQCQGANTTDMSLLVRGSLEDACFKECANALKLFAGDCDSSEAYDFDRFFANSEDCTEVSFDTMEDLTERLMQQKCLQFAPPSPLWQPNDKEAGSVAMQGPVPVCTIPAKDDHRSTIEKEYSMQRGQCPEGTRCKCLIQSIKERPTAADVRGSGHHMFVTKGSAAPGSLLKQFSKGFLVSTILVNMIIGHATVAAAIVGSLQAPLFLAVGAVIYSIKTGVNLATFKCEATLGCMPSSVVHVKGRGCRVKHNAKVGGSPVWFLPPPGTKTVSGKMGCFLDKCGSDEMKSQVVGFSSAVETASIDYALAMASITGPDSGVSSPPSTPDARKVVYNCQPLSFEDMTSPQRSILLKHLWMSGMEDEYGAELSLARS